MPSSWTSGITWTTDTPISIDRLNTYIGLNGNLDYALGNKGLSSVDYSGGNISLTGGAFVDTDATHLIVTPTVALGRVMVMATGIVQLGASATLAFDFFDGTNYASTGTSTPGTDGLWFYNTTSGSIGFSIWSIFTGVAVGSGTSYKLRSKAVTAACTLFASATAHVKMAAFEF